MNPIKRKWDLYAGTLGGVLALLFIGGFAVTIRKLSVAEFQKIYQEIAATEVAATSIIEIQKQMNQWAAYLAIVLVISFGGLITALALSKLSKYLLVAAILYSLSGLLLLIGTQFIAYPITFFYFLAGGLVGYRRKLLRQASE